MSILVKVVGIMVLVMSTSTQAKDTWSLAEITDLFTYHAWVSACSGTKVPVETARLAEQANTAVQNHIDVIYDTKSPETLQYIRNTTYMDAKINTKDSTDKCPEEIHTSALNLLQHLSLQEEQS